MPAVAVPLYLLLTGIGAGIAAVLALVPVRVTGREYARTLTWVALACLLGSLAWDAWFRWRSAGLPLPSVVCQALASLGLGVFRRRLGETRDGGRSVATLTAVVASLGVALAPALLSRALAGGDVARPAPMRLAAVQGLTGAAVLGTAICAMLLGHFYLVVPGLTIEPLKRLTSAFVVAVGLRTILAGTVILSTGAASLWHVPPPQSPDPAGEMLLGVVPLLMRVLFGLAGALALGVMALRTVAIRATQPATGILYAAVVFVLLGEFAAGYLFVMTGVPL